MRHLLVTNDFPPKVGGIQSYLWELWRRLPADDLCVLTTPHAGADAWDAAQPFRVERTRQPVLLPEPWLRRRIAALAEEWKADLVVLDPVLPLGALGPTLDRPFAVVAHGAEVTLPGRLPLTGHAMRAVLRRAALVIAAGTYPLRECEHAAGRRLPAVVVPPGVDARRFVPLDRQARDRARAGLGLPADATVCLFLSRLVPRKGADVLIRAAACLDRPDLVIAVAGEGRDRPRLERLARASGARVQFLGRIAAPDLPAAYGMADVFAMVCRDRWLGLEAEGFGIVFLEAAACGVPQIAGRSGGAHEATVDGETGLVVDRPGDVGSVARALERLAADAPLRQRLGAAARERAEREFDLDALTARLAVALDGVGQR